ncbi:MAG: hypothetical protein EBX28_03510 [Betaproteobacteria bacterium]|nr:hypothetical protein [Betaproteobacteria bacterium]
MDACQTRIDCAAGAVSPLVRKDLAAIQPWKQPTQPCLVSLVQRGAGDHACCGCGTGRDQTGGGCSVTEALLRFFAPCPRGLEQVLADELKGLGASNARIRAAGVQFEADRAGGYRANLHSRLASRVLFWLGSGQVRQDEDVYRIARRQDWTKLFTVEQRLRVDLSATRSRARSLQYLTLRIKDAVVDGFREHSEQRPSVDTQDPDVRIVGHLEADRLDLYMDWSGESLFKRGWRGRDDKGEAPLKENLAAGLVHLSQWSSDQPLADLFCGSGTILIEAAQIRWGIAPGLKRRFAFEALKDFDPLLWLSVRDDAIAVTMPLP